ncbi:hypothetical protein [Kitasatospora sp. A2-31]|uniref:hypothetical protein n=1 Tax=Kitasatospora sp. A2-31 TaxID=2916414 RepID=UPI001EEBD3E2|nr:hypothetical protein [Kitasatospora sp. A2-31]MCG6497078.1 hypothetical protein [Kitasatospora sp. A2-31]
MHRLHAAADAIDYLTNQLPRAYREEGLPGLEELAGHTRAIRDCQDDVLQVTAALHHPHAQSADRAVVRSLTAATAQLGEALGALGRAAAMAGRLYEVDGIGGPRADEVRERGSQQLNLALSRTRLALTGASENLRRDARSLTGPVAVLAHRPTPRASAATARSAAGAGAATVASLPARTGASTIVGGRRR